MKYRKKRETVRPPAVNEHIGEIAAVSPQKRQCEFGSYYPARTFCEAATSPICHHVSGNARATVQLGNVKKRLKLLKKVVSLQN